MLPVKTAVAGAGVNGAGTWHARGPPGDHGAGRTKPNQNDDSMNPGYTPLPTQWGKAATI